MQDTVNEINIEKSIEKSIQTLQLSNIATEIKISMRKIA